MDDPTTLLALDASIRRCARVAAESMVTRDPSLNRDNIRAGFERELWLSVRDAADLMRSGAVLV